ncbi:MAG: permease [Bacilli bacterium]|nr:permease [Bacilli bacterium]
MIKNIAIIFTSIFFESLPFLLLGALISSIIETFISNERLSKMIPKNKVLGSIVGVFLGFFLPACDCAVIPVSKRLLKKDVPINVAVSFMLASPIINPVVLLSTYYAFYKTEPKIFWYRLIFGIVISLIIGIIMGIIFNKKKVVVNNIDEYCECEHHHKVKNVKDAIIHIVKHTCEDLFEVVKYLMFGSLIASVVQVLLPRDVLTMFNNNPVLSIFTLLLFAYLISLCSTSDSFVGKSLLSTFSQSSIIAYLLLGPMIDIKNTIVLLGNYKKNFVVTLISLIFIVIFIFSVLVVRIL